MLFYVHVRRYGETCVASVVSDREIAGVVKATAMCLAVPDRYTRKCCGRILGAGTSDV